MHYKHCSVAISRSDSLSAKKFLNFLSTVMFLLPTFYCVLLSLDPLPFLLFYKIELCAGGAVCKQEVMVRNNGDYFAVSTMRIRV